MHRVSSQSLTYLAMLQVRKGIIPGNEQSFSGVNHCVSATSDLLTAKWTDTNRQDHHVTITIAHTNQGI